MDTQRRKRNTPPNVKEEEYTKKIMDSQAQALPELCSWLAAFIWAKV